MKTSRLLASRKVSDAGILTPLRQIEARRRQVARALDQRLQLGLAFARDRDLGAQLVARGAQLVSTSPLDGFSSDASSYSTSACSNLPVAARRRPRVEMILRRAQLGALERGARVCIVGMRAHRLGVLDHREVVVLAALGVVAAVEGAGRGAAGGDQAQREQRGDAVAARLSSGMEQ